MKLDSDLLKKNGQDVSSLFPDAVVYEAIDQMAQTGVGALLVMEGGRLRSDALERGR